MLATSRDLVTFHADRALMYRVLAEMLGAPPTPRNLRSLTEILGDAGERAVAGAAIEAALVSSRPTEVFEQYRALLRDPKSPLGCACADEHAPARHEAFTTSGRVEDSYPSSEALVLAALAERSARAIRHNDLAEAATLLDLQHRFLASHARGCLGDVAKRLIGSGAPYYEHVGRALDEITREDLLLLDHSVRPRAASR